MAKTHPPYPPEFRRQMVELVHAGRSPEELAREFEPSAQAIRNWVEQTGRGHDARGDPLDSAEREELRRLRREVRQLRQEREILANRSGAAALPVDKETSVVSSAGARGAAVSFVVASTPLANVVQGLSRT